MYPIALFTFVTMAYTLLFYICNDDNAICCVNKYVFSENPINLT